MITEFKLIPWAPSYEINAQGIVRSLPRIVYRNGFPMRLQGKVISPWMSNGYPTIGLRVDGRTVTVRLHVLIMKVLGPSQPLGKPFVLHRNGDPADFRLDNLKWGTQKDNMEDAVQHGTTPKGERQGNSKLADCNIAEMRTLRQEGLLYREIARRYGVSRQHVSIIIRGKAWSHV